MLFLIMSALAVLFFGIRHARGETLEPIRYDFAAMTQALEELTGWHNIHDWPPPEILQLQPERFMERRSLNPRHFFGEYDTRTNQIFLNLRCLTSTPDQPERLCECVIFHELGHWGYLHSGAGIHGDNAQEEREVNTLEHFYAFRIGLATSPSGAPDGLPQTEHPLSYLPRPEPGVIRTVMGPIRVWLSTHIWTNAKNYLLYRSQLVAHQGHWVSVEIFVKHPESAWELVEAWRDEGYLLTSVKPTPDSLYPPDPTYAGTWVRLK